MQSTRKCNIFVHNEFSDFFFNSTTNIGKISVISMRHCIKEIIKNKIRESHYKALFEIGFVGIEKNIYPKEFYLEKNKLGKKL